MKIVAILESSISAGGGFSQSLNAVLQMAKLCKNRFEFEVLTSRRESGACLAQLGIPAQHASISLRDTLLMQWAPSPTWRALQRRIRYLGPLERRLLGMGCDLAYFVAPSLLPAALQRLNFIATVWDLCHQEFPEFPEVRSFGEIHARERMHRIVLPAALAVISDSAALAERISRRYGVASDRIIAMPFSPAPLASATTRRSADAVLQKYSLRPGYFFYPAQFWAHKNHARILQAAEILWRERAEIDVAFAGGDKGELANLRDMASRLGLHECVRFLGFVPDEEMPALYEGCRAVVMPTYFGPTNLPPLEAWVAKRPLIYSRHLAGQAGDAALLIDPDDAASLAKAIRQCLNTEVASALVGRGSRRLAVIEAERAAAESVLGEALRRFGERRRCWTQEIAGRSRRLA